MIELSTVAWLKYTLQISVGMSVKIWLRCSNTQNTQDPNSLIRPRHFSLYWLKIAINRLIEWNLNDDSIDILITIIITTWNGGMGELLEAIDWNGVHWRFGSELTSKNRLVWFTMWHADKDVKAAPMKIGGIDCSWRTCERAKMTATPYCQRGHSLVMDCLLVCLSARPCSITLSPCAESLCGRPPLSVPAARSQ